MQNIISKFCITVDLLLEQESFGALHQMMAGLTEAERQAAWEEIEHELRQFEGPDGFIGPCELVIAVGTRSDDLKNGI